ncbi:MAG: histidine kinase [Saprospiraceae bacterium]|nr:histidine kinase [Saprospiraceae bacterium]
MSQANPMLEGNNAGLKRSVPDIIFNHLTEKDGLSFNIVTGIVQDNEGTLWISTLFGLNRYDGQRFDIFKRNKKDKTSILQNSISSICKDTIGNIWGTTEDGIFCFDQKKKLFINYYTNDSLKYPRTHSIICDNNGQIWAGSNYGLVKIDNKKSVFDYLTNDKSIISDNYISKDGILSDPKGDGLWVATRTGLNFYHFKTSKFTNYKNSNDTLMFNDHNIGAMYLSKEGMIWMFDDQTNEILGFKNVNEGILHRIPVGDHTKDAFGGTLFETSYHHIWYSSNSYETVIIDYLNGNKTEVIKHNMSDPGSISGDYIWCAWEDKDNTVWLGTTGGISRFNYDRLFYKTQKLSDRHPELNNNWQITCLAQNPFNHDWWVGTRNGKVYVVNSSNGNTEVIDFPSFKNHGITSKFITDIDFINGLAIICYAQGNTFQFDLAKKAYLKFYGLKGKYSEYKTRTISQESDSTYIFGNNYFPVLRWNSVSDKIEEINFRTQKTKAGNYYTAGWLKSSYGKGAWMAASNNTLGYIHPGSTYIELIEPEFGMNVLKGGFYSAMEIDSDGNAWFSFLTQGLYQAKKKVEKIKSNKDIELLFWDGADGLVNENIQSAVSDKNGHIWSGAFNKYSVFNPSQNNFKNFKINLSENNAFYYNYMIPLANGNILTNIKGNLIEFFPDKIGSSFPKNLPLISVLHLPEKNIYLSGETMVRLEPEENFITIGFGCLSDMELYPYHFEYQLEGVNKEWVIADQNAEATYSDLEPGTYIFKLVARSSDQSWKSSEKTLTILIKAPFHKTWWFLSLMILLTGFILFYTLRGRIRNIRNINELKSKAQLLEKEKTAVMYENLKQHLNPHFLFNSLTSLSSLIRIDQRQAGDFLDKMSKVYRYILKNKDNETVPLIEELKFVDMYNQLQKTRFGDGLQIKIDIQDEYYHRKIAPVTLQNLVENAIKHNIADEETPLVISMYIDDDYLVVQNNLQTKGFVETSNKQGQNSMVSLYRFLSPRAVVISESEDFYIVKIPLI